MRGVPAGSTTTYQTEIANFSQVTAIAGTNGPSYFTVQGKDGLTYEYGNTTDSKILPCNSGCATPYFWALDKVTDRYGNQMVFKYQQSSGSYVPLSIEYTAPSGSTSFPYEVSFGYTTKSSSDTISAFIAGSQVQQTQQLSTITMTSSGTVVREYKLSYTTTTTTLRASLTGIQECGNPTGSGGTASDCLAATSVGYQQGTAGLGSPTTATGSGTTNGTVYSVDIDGDGKQDLVFATTNTSGNYVWWAQLATASGYGAPISIGAVTVGTTDFLLDDFAATGGTEILAPVSIGGTTWYAYQLNAAKTAFTATTTNVPIVVGAKYSSADVDGDGRPDLVNVVVSGSSFTEGIELNTTTADAISFVKTPTNNAVAFGADITSLQIYGNNQLPNSAVKHFDFDGDGRQDLILYIYSVNLLAHNTDYIVDPMLSRGTSAPVFNGGLGSLSVAPSFFGALNWNDDACTDLIEGAQILISACNGSLESGVTLPTTPSIALDWDGDGRTDVLADINGMWEVYRSEGSAVAPEVAAGITLGAGTYVVTDQNGDGLNDVVFANSATNYAIDYGLHNGTGKHPDLATSFADGFLNSASPSYVSIAQSSVYSAGATQTYPYESFVGPLYVVNQATFSDPSSSTGATYQQNFSYAGAAQNLQGRGFNGFASIQRYDSRNAIWETWVRDLIFPYTGMLTEYVVSQNSANTVLIDYKTNTPALTTLDATMNNERYFPYFTYLLDDAYEVGGTENGQAITETQTYPVYDNYGNVTSLGKSVTDVDSNSPFFGQQWDTTISNTIAPQTGPWCLNLPTQTTITNSAPNEPSIARTVAFTPDYANCRQTQQVIAPGTPYEVTIGYGYTDGFGNLTTETVTGNNMAARTTSYSWGTSGQFLTTITNPMYPVGNALAQTTTLGFDPNSGMQTSQTDPNGITVSWQYDDFARQSKEIRPDGTATTWSYNLCVSCVPASQTEVIAQVLDVSGHVVTTSNLYYDKLDRETYRADTLMSGSLAWQLARGFDSLGRIQFQNFPYLLGTNPPGMQTYYYDLLNRPTKIQRPISATNSNLQTTTFGYVGRTATIQDALGNTTTKINYVTGNLYRSIDAKAYYQNFTYDSSGSLLSVTDSASPSNTLFTASYSYGIGAFQTSSTDMDMGVRHYTLDALGEVVAYTDAMNQSVSIQYDLLSRPTTRTEPDMTTQWTWGTGTINGAAAYNIGKLQSLSATSSSFAGTWSDSFTYDTLGRPSTETYSNPGDRTYQYIKTYDPTTGFLSSLQYPVDISFILTLNYGYSNGILQSISSNSYNPAVTYWTANAVNPRGQVTQETYGNGAVKTLGYDAITGWLGNVKAGVGGGAGLQNNSYAYDDDGNVTQRQDNKQGLTENFYYDNMNRLDHSTLNGTINLQMTYDTIGMGNIAARSDVANGATWTYDPVRKHEVTQAGSFAYTYDANGNMTSRNGYAIPWTSYNYPLAVSTATESVTFQYGGDRQRWQEVYTNGANATETTYHAGKLFEVAYYAEPGVGVLAHYRHYIYAGNELVSVDDRSTAAYPQYYILSDHQGGIASIVTGSSESCPAGYTLSGSSCVDVLSTPATVQYSCPTGYSLSATTCSETITAAALVSYACPTGYSLSGTTCSETQSKPASVRVYCPGAAVGASVSSGANGIAPDMCSGGYDYYYCPTGWTLSGTTCYETLTQAATPVYSCSAGYALAGTTCSETLSQAATVSYSCPSGYTLSGSTCTETLTATGSGASVFVPESFTAYGLSRSGETWSGAPVASDSQAIGIVTRRGYTGETTLGVSMGLNHLNGRIEDSITGRFLSPDPNVPDPGNTQSFNRYSYVNNNPLSFIDPTGFCPKGQRGCAPHSRTSTPGAYSDSGSGDFGGDSSEGDDTGALTAWYNAASDAILNSENAEFDSATSDNTNSGTMTAYASASGNVAGGIPNQSADPAQSQTTVDMSPSADGLSPVVVTAQSQQAQQGFGSDPGFAGSSIDQISEIDVTATRPVSAQVGPSLIENYTVTIPYSAYVHIGWRHMYQPIPGAGRYHKNFWSFSGIQKLVTDTTRGAIGTRQPNGNYRLTADLGYITGTDALNNETQYNTLIIRPVGPGAAVVVTEFPGQYSDDP